MFKKADFNHVNCPDFKQDRYVPVNHSHCTRSDSCHWKGRFRQSSYGTGCSGVSWDTRKAGSHETEPEMHAAIKEVEATLKEGMKE